MTPEELDELDGTGRQCGPLSPPCSPMRRHPRPRRAWRLGRLYTMSRST